MGYGIARPGSPAKFPAVAHITVLAWLLIVIVSRARTSGIALTGVIAVTTRPVPHILGMKLAPARDGLVPDG